MHVYENISVVENQTTQKPKPLASRLIKFHPIKQNLSTMVSKTMKHKHGYKLLIMNWVKNVTNSKASRLIWDFCTWEKTEEIDYRVSFIFCMKTSRLLYTDKFDLGNGEFTAPFWYTVFRILNDCVDWWRNGERWLLTFLSRLHSQR